MKIHLPNSAFIGNIDPFLRSIKTGDSDKLEITSNKSWVSVHPVILTMLAAKATSIGHKHVTLEAFTAKSRNYFERMHLFHFLDPSLQTTITEREPSGRFIPITQIKDSLTLSTFVTDMIPLLHLTPPHAESIRYVVSELVRNVLEHASSRYGAFVAAQYYPKSNAIKIGVADTGVGIKATISHAHKAPTDLEALRLALQPGITGTTSREGGTSQNAGAGLFFIKSIAHVNQSLFMIYSGTGFYKLRKNTKKSLPIDPWQDRHTKYNDLPSWPGTVVAVDISLDNTPEFTSLLDQIRRSYTQAIKERRKARYRQPRFI